MIDYSKMAQKALVMITKYGRPVLLSRIDRTPDDPTRPWRGSTGDVTINATAVFVEPTSGTELGILDERGPDDEVIRGYKIAFLASEENPTEDLKLYDRMIDGGRVYSSIKVHELCPGPVSLLYTVEVRS